MASARAMRRMQGDPLLAAAESAFGGGSDSSDESSDEGETPAPLNAFALLGDDDDDDDDDESAEEKEEEPEPVKETTPPPASKKKKKKKQKQRQTPDDDGGDGEGEAVEDDGIDEITAALREIGEEMPTPRPDGDASSAADAASISGRDPLMCVDTRRLKAEDELRSIFGAKVIHAVETEEGNRGGLGLGGQQGLAHIGRNPRGRKANQGAKLASTTRSTLVQPKDSWPPLRAKSVGLAMECVGVEGHLKTFRFVRDTAGADADAAYQRAVASHDPNNLHALLQYWPWHVDALLALSDVYHYAGEGSKSAELLERALYAMEGAWHPWFAGCVADGTARMDARVVPAGAEGGAEGGAEDASGLFFGTMFKHVQALTRRGCHRAALECSKLALSLDRTDPRGFLCCVDYFALRCGEEDWLLDFADSYRSDGSLLSHPSYAYSTALARLGGGRPGRRVQQTGATNGKEGKGNRKGNG